MFNTPVLDLVILLTFIYFVGSIILSAINEAIAGTFKLRPSHLVKSLEKLFFGGGWSTFVSGTLLTSPHILSLMEDQKSYPAYIPARNFVSAIIHEFATAVPTHGLVNAITSNTTLPQETKDVLLDLAYQANQDWDDFQKRLATFYDDAMDRAGGWYKRKMRLLLLIIGFLVSFAMNIDTLRIARESLTNKDALSKTVDNIVSQLPNIKVGKDSLAAISIKQKDGSIIVQQKAISVDSTDKLNTIKKNIKAVQDLNIYLQEYSGVTIGYSNMEAFKKQWLESPFGDILISLVGILITAFALQLSSNFWFDLMNKAANIRAAGKKPDTNRE